MSEHTGNGFGTMPAEFQPIPEEAPRVKEMEVDLAYHAQRITRLTLREPTAGQFEKALLETRGPQGGDTYSNQRFKTTLVAGVCKLPREVIEQLPVTQLEEAASFLLALLNRGQPIGEN
jgi:hypothetical protein